VHKVILILVKNCCGLEARRSSTEYQTTRYFENVIWRFFPAYKKNDLKYVKGTQTWDYLVLRFLNSLFF
jgi:hypothetical protein